MHLNFYTQYMYNIWHKTEQECPLCKKIPESVYHIILECQFTNELWKQIEPFLKELHPVNITDEEKAFGIAQKKTTVGILLRNWLTYLLRQSITEQEKTSFYTSKKPQLEKFKQNFKYEIGTQIKAKQIRYKNENKLPFFDKIITYQNVLCTKTDNELYEIANVF